MKHAFLFGNRPFLVPNQPDTVQQTLRMLERIRLSNLNSHKRSKKAVSPAIRLMRAKSGGGRVS